MALATSPPRSGWMARQQLPVWPSQMGLAVALCVALSATIQAMAGVLVGDAAIISFVARSLAAVWPINHFFALPVVSPGFVHLLTALLRDRTNPGVRAFRLT